MSTNHTLHRLETCLKREIPAYSWYCQQLEPSSDALTRPTEEIEVTAMENGERVPGYSCRFRKSFLKRWGAQAVARQLSIGMSRRNNGVNIQLDVMAAEQALTNSWHNTSSPAQQHP